MTTPLTDNPTIGTLGDEDLYLAKITIAALGYADVAAHIDAASATVEREMGIYADGGCAALEHLAERWSGAVTIDPRGMVTGYIGEPVCCECGKPWAPVGGWRNA